MKAKLPSVHASHDKPQLYRHKYCSVCMTGLLGCRWHRYQQSTRESRKRDLIFFTTVVLCFLHMVVFFYIWLVSRNNIYQITADMYLNTKAYFPWVNVGLGVSSIMLIYLSGILILCLFHIQSGHQLYLHPFHLLVTCLLEVICIIVSVLVDIYWPQTWPLVYLSLRVYSAVFQIVAVVILTALAWLVVRQWLKLTFVYKVIWLPVMLVVLLGVYLIPVWMDSPIIGSTTPDKPGIIAMGGASNIAPENTLFAFKKALTLGVTRIQTTVQFSFDGVPFLYQDNSLVRTTDIEEVRNSNISKIPMRNTISELQMLNAGSWFIKHDPWGTVWKLTENETLEVNTQNIPTLLEFLQFVADYPELEVFLIVQPLPDWHPHCCNPGHIIKQVLSESEAQFNWSNIYVPVWLYYNLTQTDGFMPAEHHREATTLYMSLDSASLLNNLRHNKKNGLTTVVSDVNSQWLYSVLWCAGADYVATRYIEDIQGLTSPVLHLNTSSYTALWVTVDILSVVVIIVIFIVHRIKLYGATFSPESISLNTARTKASYRSRTMKEKLLRECMVVDSTDDLEARDNDGMENRPAFSMPDHQAYSLSFLTGTGTATPRNRNVSVSADEPPRLSLPPTITSRCSV